ncbi:putative methyltransferase [Actinomadura craniellae]|uniref:Putative methyltransferase n=1 Tax=Actinomadura craniellae TaxID=2231787 RepID=A0A365H9A0_9ACTN|nr:bis-aminopropyl spermidine synthase family protein [Actinomadura craniellae]RAY15675.1 putative methyltransferase [Actinomadura craniellae]
MDPTPSSAPSATAGPEPDDGFGPLQELMDGFGIDRRRIADICCLLAGGAYLSVAEIVSRTGSSRRTVEMTIAAAGDRLETSGDAFRVAPEHVLAYRDRFRCGGYAAPPADPWDAPAAADPAALAEMRRLVAEVPAPLQSLDHVPATAETALKRAHFMLRGYDLRGARVLCVGDHDLTSLALFLAGGAAGLGVTVVDIDERTLEYIDVQARRLGFDVRVHYADLRLGLPAALRDSCDLVFTDPPYTPEGVRLFAARGLAALADQHNGRLLVAYGFGERQPALGLAVQEALAPLHLVYEAVLPGFNRFTGAQAIGAAAALYVLRPTRRSRAAAEAPAGTGPGVYTHGVQSVEAKPAGLDPAAAARVLDLAGLAGGRNLLVGDGWPEDVPGRRVGLAPFLAAPLPRGAQGHDGVAVDLHPGYGASLLRALLAAGADRVAVLCRSDLPELRDAAGQRRLAELVAPKYRIARLLRSTPAPDLAVVVAERAEPDPADPPAVLAAHVYARAHGKIGNSWREGLIALDRARGRTLTKARARAAIAATGRADLTGHTLLDLPRHVLPALREALAASIEALAED